MDESLYIELASALLKYESNRRELINILKTIFLTQFLEKK